MKHFFKKSLLVGTLIVVGSSRLIAGTIAVSSSIAVSDPFPDTNGWGAWTSGSIGLSGKTNVSISIDVRSREG